MKKRTLRTVLDALLSSMIVVEMFIQYTGVFLHEIIGFVFFASILTHIGISASWISSAAGSASEGTLNGRRKALAIMGILLAAMVVILGTSSVAISTILASVGFVWPFGTLDFWTILHTFSSYGLCALVVVHLAMHWGFLAKAMKVPYNPERRRAIGASVNTVAAVGAAALGIVGVREVFTDSVEAATARLLEIEAAARAGAVSETGAVVTTAQTVEEPQIIKDTPSKVTRSEHKSTSQPPAQEAQDTNTASSDTEQAPGADKQTYDSYNSYDTYNSYDEGSSGSSTSGICTLCHKYCSLSAPRCSRPYQAGLI